MGQPKVASVTWRDRIRRISQGFYETMGQQIPQTRRSKAMRAWSHVKILNRDLRSTVIFIRKPKGIGQTFRLRGRQCTRTIKHEKDYTYWCPKKGGKGRVPITCGLRTPEQLNMKKTTLTGVQKKGGRESLEFTPRR